MSETKYANHSYFVQVDVHNFIFFNDKFGHERGDNYLAELENRITTMCYYEKYDSYDNEVTVLDVKRIGGNRFTFTLTGVNGKKEVLTDLSNWSMRNWFQPINIAACPIHRIATREADTDELIKVAINSGGNLILYSPFREGDNESYINYEGE